MRRRFVGGNEIEISFTARETRESRGVGIQVLGGFAKTHAGGKNKSKCLIIVKKGPS